MKTTFKIPGMHCKSCVTLVSEVSKEFPTVHDVTVDLDTKDVTLEHDEAMDLGAWKNEIESLGDEYKVINQ